MYMKKIFSLAVAFILTFYSSHAFGYITGLELGENDIQLLIPDNTFINSSCSVIPSVLNFSLDASSCTPLTLESQAREADISPHYVSQSQQEVVFAQEIQVLNQSPTMGCWSSMQSVCISSVSDFVYMPNSAIPMLPQRGNGSVFINISRMPPEYLFENDNIGTQYQVVPEPGTIMLFLLGSSTILGWRRIQRQKSNGCHAEV